MVREFPFVQGEAMGVNGRFMLDTGVDQALIINDHHVPVAGGTTIGKGHFGSGETFAVRLIPGLNDIRIGQLRYAHATQVASQDARQLEEITPDFLGWIGFYFWSGYSLKLDYQKLQATFYKGPPEAYLSGERLIAKLPFEIRKLPNHPVMHVSIGGIDMIASFDTGQYGALYTNAKTKALLIAAGSLTSSSKNDGSFDLKDVVIGGRDFPGIKNMDVNVSVFPAAAPIGLKEDNILSIGYGFLSQYKTVWDYQRRYIYLLAR